MKEHDADLDKDFWEQAVICLSSDASLTTAHSKLLEFLIHEKARKLENCVLHNDSTPARPAIIESQEQEVLHYIDQLTLILPTLGVNILQSYSPSSHASSDTGPQTIFEFETKGARAKAQEVNGKFVVLKGSQACKTETSSLQDNYRILRQSLIAENVLKNMEGAEYYQFARDYPFDNTSSASSVVAGASSAGPQAWKLSDGKTYKQYRAEQIALLTSA